MKPSLLFITTSSNWPLTDGKRQRTWFLVEALSLRFNVDLLLIGYQNDKEQIEKSTNTIKNLFFFNISDANLPNLGYPSFLLSKKQKSNNDYFFNQVHQLFSELNDKNQYSFVFSRYLWPLLVLTLPKEIKIVCDIDDVYFEAQKSRIQKETNFLRKLKLQVLFFFGTKKVKKLLDRIDIPIIVKESDRSFYGLINSVCVPNIPFGFYIDKKSPIKNAIITSADTIKFGFIGKLSYRPNYKGLIDFINLVWNPLIKIKPEFGLVIAGSGEIPEVLKKTISDSKNIELLGFLESPETFWNQISTLIVPIGEGAGSNIKIAEAFIYGKAVIANPFASRGYDAFVGDPCLYLSKNDNDWIQIMTNLSVPSPEQMETTALKARTLFDIEQWNQILLKALDK